MSEVLTLAKALIARESISPNDAGCQQLISEYLTPLGFTVESLDCEDVKNCFITHAHGSPTLIFLGHTDVVPPGPLDAWTSPPFTPTIRDGKLYGRGSADMKSSVAAMVIALTEFVKAHPKHPGRVGLLITSDEEARAEYGIRHVAKLFAERGEQIDYCVVGEPSCQDQFGDIMKIGRRGSLNGVLSVHGQQGHVAYPDKALNPIPIAAQIINALSLEVWDQGNADFPATSWQISNINAGTGANNVIPHSAELTFNFRFAPTVTANELQQRTAKIIQYYHQNYDLNWHLSGEPFYCQNREFIEHCQMIIQQHTGLKPHACTLGGTSDGRFIAPLGTAVIEFGPLNSSIHQINECVDIDCLIPLTYIYTNICESICS